METFSPFPLRARGVIEQFDAAIKLYKQYFWVLLGWSAIVAIASLVSGLIGFFLTPIVIGAVACSVAAAVRGQSVEFGQCWRFTQPRYWQVLWYSFVATLAGGLVIAAMIGALVALFIAGAAALGNAPTATRVTIGVFAFLSTGTLATLVSTVFISWLGLVPIVVCLEDDKRNSRSLGRAFDLLSGNWLRITALMAIVGAAMLALSAILGGLATFVVGFNNLRELMSGHASDSALMHGLLALLGFGGAYTLLLMLWTPLYYLILTVFYLDVRVRREALDLEWTAYATDPHAALRDVARPGGVHEEPLSAAHSEYSQPDSLSGTQLSADFSLSATENFRTAQHTSASPPGGDSPHFPQ
jgi:hypothetical protein